MATSPKTLPKNAPTAEIKGTPGRKRKPFDYSKPEQKFRYRPSDFAAFLAGYPDLRAVSASIYRLRPKIDLGRIGKTERSIHKSADLSEMTPEFCKRKFGNGLYMLKFNDENRPSGQQEAATAWFDIDDADTPPIYDLRTLLLNDSSNADEVDRLIGMRMLTRDESGSLKIRTEGDDRPAQPLPSAPVMVAMPTPAVPSSGVSLGDQLLVKLLDRALPSVQEKPPTAGELLEQSFQIADRLRPTAAAVAPPLSLDQIADAVAARMNRNPAPAGGLESDLQTYERIGSLLEKVGAGKALESGAPGWLGPVLDMAKPLVPVLVGAISRMGAPPAPQAAPGAVQPQRQPAALPDRVQPPFPAFLPATANVMDRITEVVNLALIKFREGVSGFDFAAWLCGFYPGGKEMYGLLENAGGPAECLGFVAMVPALKQQVDQIDKAALEEWLTDFFTYEPAREGEAEEVEGEVLPKAA